MFLALSICHILRLPFFHAVVIARVPVPPLNISLPLTENHVYAILEPPTLKSKWRPISGLLGGKVSQTACSTLPASRAPQPPTAPPPEDSNSGGGGGGGGGVMVSNKPDVTLCGNDDARPMMQAAMMASFRKQCYSPQEQRETQNRQSLVRRRTSHLLYVGKKGKRTDEGEPID